MKRYVCLILAVLFLVASCGDTVSSDPADGEANPKTDTDCPYNPDIKTDKPNGFCLSWPSYYGETMYDFLDMSDVVFVGTVLDSGKDYKDPYSTDKTPLTEYRIKVDEVLYGEIFNKEISFIQLGRPMDDYYEMRIAKDDKILVLANYEEKWTGYRSVCNENGIFYIREDGLYTYSNKPDMGKYDGTPLELLKRDLADLIEEYNMTPENNFYARVEEADEAE